MRMPSDIVLIGAGAVVLLAVVYVAIRGTKNAAADVTAGTIDAGAGVVIGIGDAFGIPRTQETACEKAKREGRTWDASFSCPAGAFIKYLIGE